MDFAALSLSPPLLQVVRELGYETLTPIQAASIPVLLRGEDLIGQSQTGSGKTAAFTLPILEKLELRADARILQALVLCPTRELCAQVATEMRRLAKRIPGVHVVELGGGQPIAPQVVLLERGAHVAVGTPGRLIDLLQRRALGTESLRTVVLDEADRMLDMGFHEDIEHILASTPKTRQTVLFSATYPPTIESLSQHLQRNPTRVTIEAAPEVKPDIRQVLYTCEAEARGATLLRLLREHTPESALVFCNFKASVTELVQTLRQGGVSAAGLQGDMEQRDRDTVMATFRNRSTRVLVATDVAARGLDVEGLDAVFNLELPQQPEIYVHRIGRTARAGRVGAAYSLAMPKESRKVEELEKFTGQALERAELPPEREPPPALEAAMATLHIDAGRKDKMRPGDILGALTGEAGSLAATDVGKIEIHDHHAYVAVSRPVARAALEALRAGRIKGKRHRIDLVRV